jgi:hypothetical protein
VKNIRLLGPEDYRWTASLPDNERKIVMDLIVLLDARFVDRPPEERFGLNTRFVFELTDQEQLKI